LADLRHRRPERGRFHGTPLFNVIERGVEPRSRLPAES
jgi:hypothetical protein